MANHAAESGTTRLVVEASDAGIRLDAFLVRRQQSQSTSAARRMVASGVVRVSGKVAKKGYRVQAGDQVDLAADRSLIATLAPAPNLPLDLVYEDEWIVAVNKPAGLPAHPLKADETHTLAGALVARFPGCAQASPDPREGGLAHRLDVGTSGVLVAARSREAWHRLREALSDPACEKIYLAELWGAFPAGLVNEFILPGRTPDSYVVTAPIGRQGRRGERVVLAGGRNPLPSRTEFRLVERRAESCLVEARLSKGRTHQVRVHAASLGTPVWGDEVYGHPADGLRLHAHAVVFVHPFTTRALRLEARGPAWTALAD